MPIAFEIDGGWLVLLARFVSVAALFSLLGTVAFRAWVLPRAACAMPEAVLQRLTRSLRRLEVASVGVCAVAELAWLAVQAADMAGARSLRATVAALPTVLGQTDFGHLVIAQWFALFVTGAALARRGPRLALACAGVATALQAGHSHAASMDGGPGVLLAADIAHLLAAGLWLGALAPLLLTVAAAPPKAGALAARWFSPMGKLCVVALAATAFYQSWVLVGSIPGLAGTGYGWAVLGKLTLFAVLFAFALANRYRLAPALLTADPARAKRALLRSVAWQTAAGLAILAVAALLSSMPPSMHEQPVWPFSDRFTLDVIDADPEFRNEVVWALAVLAVGGLLVALAPWIGRRWRWAALTPSIVIAWFAVPHLDLLFVPAYPTSFFHSPTRFATGSILQGAALFPSHCAACHGAEGQGDGPAARGSPVPPADLTAAHLWMHSDGELFWWLTHGIEAPEGGIAMPGFAAALSPDDRWALIDAIRAHNAGMAFHTTGDWPVPLQAPELQAVCEGGRTLSLADLRGSFVRLVIASAPSRPTAGLTTVLVTTDPAAKPAPGLCIAGDGTIAPAYAIVTGVTAAEVSGAQFLIDGDGWLRAVQRPGSSGWNDADALLADVQRFQARPIHLQPEAMDPNMQM